MIYEEVNIRSVKATLTGTEVENILVEAALAKLPGQPVSRFSPNVSHSVALDRETGEVTVHVTVDHNHTGGEKK